jgi:hypothetical protein
MCAYRGGFKSFLVLANKIAPGVVDHDVARTAVRSQQADIPADPERPANLWQPVDERHDHGARGRFEQLEGGVLHVRWLSGLPRLVIDVARSATDRLAEVLRDHTSRPGPGRGRDRDAGASS